MDSIFSYLFWGAIIAYAIFTNIKKQAVEASKTIVEAKTPQQFDTFDTSKFKIFTHESSSMETEAKSLENVAPKYKSRERTDISTVNSEQESLQRRQQKKQKPEKPAKPVKQTKEESALPSIKKTKPLKPEKPKKDDGIEEYAQHQKKPHPIRAFIADKENVRNAFIVGELFKKRF